MNHLHFIAGLPRSGSTLLAAILRQNPQIEAGMSSPVGGIFTAVQGAIGRKNEAALFLSDEQKERMLQGAVLGVLRGQSAGGLRHKPHLAIEAPGPR